MDKTLLLSAANRKDLTYANGVTADLSFESFQDYCLRVWKETYDKYGRITYGKFFNVQEKND